MCDMYSRSNLNPRGLYDLERKIRPVGEAYKKIIREWGNVLPTRSFCLRVPVYSPRESKVAEQASARDVAAGASPTAQATAKLLDPANTQERS